jgi:uncharacterized protein YdhG (YjbR/CyaY superfamily)
VNSRSTAASIDEYMADFPAGTQEMLRELRALIREAAPEVVETMSYAIPTLDLHGRHLVHFAGYKNHVGFYPAPSAIEAFKAELAPYETAKGSVRFPLDRPLPVELISRMVEFRVRETQGDLPGGRPAR